MCDWKKKGMNNELFEIDDKSEKVRQRPFQRAAPKSNRFAALYFPSAGIIL